MKKIQLLKNTHKNFTLLELLIVIAIIAILASLAIPNFKKAKDHAVSMACMNQQAQLAQVATSISLSGYDSDSDGIYLESNHKMDSAKGTYLNLNWMQAIADTAEIQFSGSDDNVIIKKSLLLSCPARPQLAQTTKNQSHFGINPYLNNYPSIAMVSSSNSGFRTAKRQLYHGAKLYHASPALYSTIRIGAIDAPSNIVYFADSLDDNNKESELTADWGDTGNYHNTKKKGTFVSLDGASHAIRNSEKSSNGGPYLFSPL